MPGFFFTPSADLSDRPTTASRARLPGMDLSKMTTAEVQAMLRLLAEWEREELVLSMQERLKAEQEQRLY